MAWIGTAWDKFFPTPIKPMAKLPLALIRAGSDPACVHWKLSKGQKLSRLNNVQHFSSYGNYKFLPNMWTSQSWDTSFWARRLLREHRHLRSTRCFTRTISHPANNTYNKNNIFHSHILLSCKLFLRYLDMEFMRNTCKNPNKQSSFIPSHKITSERTSFQKMPTGTCQVCRMPKASSSNILQMLLCFPRKQLFHQLSPWWLPSDVRATQ